MQDFSPIFLSIKLSFVTTLFLFAFGIPFSYWLSVTKNKLKPALEAIIALPIVLPPTVLGFYILLAIGSNGPFGKLYESIFDSQLAFSFTGLVVGSFFYSFPFAVQPIQSAFESIDKKLIEASWTLGKSQFETFRRIILPLSRKGLITGGVLSFAHTMGEFGVVLMVGGNIPGVTKVASIAIYDEVQALNYRGANIYSLILLLISFSVLLMVYVFNRQTVRAL
ncbi:MAG: molybdate ABC transporter permease subunit [Deltaproteobacteria bacterium]|nr:molybdate ABC transporter permease subunit [Deltaproteobacteria bacterium]